MSYMIEFQVINSLCTTLEIHNIWNNVQSIHFVHLCVYNYNGKYKVVIEKSTTDKFISAESCMVLMYLVCLYSNLNMKI